MSIPLALVSVVAGVVLVVTFAGRLVRGAVGTSSAMGVSAFLISVIFIGFDPENLAVGVAGSVEQVPGIALGSVVGAAMVALALAFGVTALLAPMRFASAPTPVLAVPVAAVALFGVVSLDGRLSRLDGAVLLLGYALAVAFLIWLSRRGVDVASATEPDEPEVESARRAVGMLVVALIAIVVGSELAVEGSKTVIAWLGVADTFYGMAILALLVSIEELARELPAARRGHPEITFGNVVGSTLAFFLFNGGLIALARPVELSASTTTFYLPVAFVTVVVISGLMLRKAVPRWAGAVLVGLYLLFVIGGYLVDRAAALGAVG